ncbi:MAG: zinc transporter, family [Methanobacteriaceae archaeon]|nr:zinc transporter, family [Methanobacteriaceae archaeon]
MVYRILFYAGVVVSGILGILRWFSPPHRCHNRIFSRMPKRLVASIMAFGAGVLISAIDFELMDEAYKFGGFLHTILGFISGAVIFTGVNVYLQ